MNTKVDDQNSEMQQLLEETGWDIRSFRYGDIVEGRIVAKGKSELLVDIGGKSEGIIMGKELDDSYLSFDKLSIGDKILSFVIHDEDDQGYVVLSLKRAESERKWIELKESEEKGTAVEVEVVDYNKGGLLVEVASIRGFIPVSHIDRAHFPDDSAKTSLGSRAERENILSSLLGEKIQARVIELDRNNNRLILSEKMAKGAKVKRPVNETMPSLIVGDVVDGTVSAVLPFGIFVDMDGFEGLVHISELSWGKVSDPAELFNIGDPIKVKVIEVDPEENKVSLSVKDLLDDPWKNTSAKYNIGDVIKGKVTKITPYGAFVRVEDGLDGLLHVSETDGPLNEGQEIEAKIISLEPEGRKLGLSVRQLSA